VVLLPDEISDDIEAILDPLGNAVHTALSFDLLGENVLITGAGPIGIMAAAIARHAGARNVVITDINQDRLDLAATLADVVPVNVTKNDLSDIEAQLKIAQGFDIGLEMSGNQIALNQMIEALVMGGRIALLGIPPGKSSVDWSRIVFKAITIKGIYGREIFETWYKMIAMLQNGLDVSGVITHRFKMKRLRQRICHNEIWAIRQGCVGLARLLTRSILPAVFAFGSERLAASLWLYRQMF
jgi:threonine 3-dehydrogenase